MSRSCRLRRGRRSSLLGDAAAFAGVARFPARIKCGLLGWMALRDALAKTLTDPVRDD